MNKAFVVLIAMLMTLMLGVFVDANDSPEQRQPKVKHSLKHDTSPALRDLQPPSADRDPYDSRSPHLSPAAP